MTDEKPMKSAYELAMERLEKQDKDEGVEHRRLTDEQKAAVAEIRSFYQAELAQIEILHKSQLVAIHDPAERETLEENYQRERGRLSRDRDAKIEKAQQASD
jgi:hypothetical protein